MKLVRRLALSTVLCAGWLVLLLGLLLWAAETSGMLAWIVRDAIAAETGALGADVRVTRARLRWFESALEIEGLTAGELARIDAARIELDLFATGGPRAERIEVQGGKVVLSRALWNSVQRYGESVAQRGGIETTSVRWPTVVVEGLDLEARLASPQRLAIGRLDALLRADAKGEPELYGRLVPSFAEAPAGESEICLYGAQRDAGTFEVRATGARLPLEADLLPREAAFETARSLDPHGELHVDGFARFDLEGKSAPLGRLRLALRDASVLLAHGRHRLRDLSIDLQASWAPKSATQWADPDALEALATVRGRLDQGAFDATAVWGTSAGEGHRAKAWMHAPRLALDPALLELAGDSPALRRAWDALGPSGGCEAWIGATVPRGTDAIGAPRIGVQLRFDGDAGITYRGWPGSDGKTDQGFPLPLQQVTGDFVLGGDPAGRRALRAGLFGLEGQGGGARIRARGEIRAPAFDTPASAPGGGDAEIDLAFSTERLPVGEPVFAALRGLAGVVDPEATWAPFAPSSGDLAVDLRLTRTTDLRYVAVALELALTDVALRWSELPIDVARANGRLAFRSDGVRDGGVSFALDGALSTAQRVRVAGRFQTDPTLARPAGEAELDEISAVAVALERASLTGDDRRVFAEKNPDVGAILDEVAARGFVDVAFERVRERGATHAHAEVVPRAPVELKPKQFEMITRDVRGRVLVVMPDGAPARTRLTPLCGTWGGAVEVAFVGSFPERSVAVFGAGIDPSSGALVGSLESALRGAASADAPLEASALRAEGALDVVGELTFGGADAPQKSRYRVFLRDGALATADGFRLDGLRGVLEYDGAALAGRDLRARLAGTPIDLASARFVPAAEGWRFEADFAARGLPVDDAHLAGLVAAPAREALFGELEWKGSLDVTRGDLAIVGGRDGTRLELSGAIVPRGMSIKLGLPIVISDARAVVERFVLEGGRARALVRVEDFDGEIAGRRLRDATLLLTYVEPNLSIETLDGELEGGRIGALGEGAQRDGTAFSISLEEPYAFQVALDLEGVEVAGLFRGLFPSNIATKGVLDGRLRLSGDMGRLLGISGSGSVQIVDSKLWSIPVFRALLGQLGLDDTAVFDRMSTNLRIHDGRVEMSDIAVASTLINLVGDGRLEFDGAIRYDLEVRYTLLDRLGPVTKMLYWMQNKLLSVAIRGDLARPVVLFVGPIDRLFGTGSDAPRELPLPPFSSLPPRF